MNMDPKKFDEDISFQEAIIDWPSSTRAELGAIAIALLAVPCKTRVRILTDSKNTIKLINQNIEHSLVQKELKLNNGNWLRAIRDYIQKKRINLELVKVKAHARVRGN